MPKGFPKRGDDQLLEGGGAGAADVIVAINRADSNRGVSIPSGTYDDLVAGSEAMGGMRDLPPRSFLMLRVR